MNRRFHAGELSLHEVAQNLQPVGNVDRITSPGVGLPPATPGDRPSGDRDRSTRPEATSGGPSISDSKGGEEAPFEETGLPGGIDLQRAQAVDALHSYIVAAVGYDHRRALLILNRVLSTLDFQLAASPRAGHRHR